MKGPENCEACTVGSGDYSRINGKAVGMYTSGEKTNSFELAVILSQFGMTTRRIYDPWMKHKLVYVSFILKIQALNMRVFDGMSFLDFIEISF